MKYFTWDWWMSGSEDVSNIDDYWNYLESVKDKIPDNISQFVHNYTLHDSRLVELRISTEKKECVMVFDGFDKELVNSLNYELIYTGFLSVDTLFHSSEPLEHLLSGGFGSVGYDEFELLQNGIISHKILFETGVELVMIFEELIYKILEKQ